MKYSEFIHRLKPWMLPLAMLCGLLFHNIIEAMAFLTPWLIFAMLFITFCRIEPKEMRITGLSLSLLCVQLGGALAIYLALLPVSTDVAQGAFICVFCPTATAAPVITGMLGGNIARLATFSLVSNMAVALTAPAAFTLMGSADIDFTQSVSTIAMRVLPLILGPLVTALVLKGAAPALHRRISSSQSIGFYLWAVSLIIVVGRAVSFVMKEPPSRVPELVALALVAGVVCVAQFVAGRRIGRRYGDRIAGAQGLGQKNTVLAIWMALTYLNPVTSVAPAAYIAWQNTINSLQLYLKQKKRDSKLNSAAER